MGVPGLTAITEAEPFGGFEKRGGATRGRLQSRHKRDEESEPRHREPAASRKPEHPLPPLDHRLFGFRQDREDQLGIATVRTHRPALSLPYRLSRPAAVSDG